MCAEKEPAHHSMNVKDYSKYNIYNFSETIPSTQTEHVHELAMKSN